MKVHSKQLFYSILFLLIAARIQADEFLYKQMSISEGFPPYIQPKIRNYHSIHD